MDRIRFLGLLRRVEKLAADRGYHGDPLDDEVRDCGSYKQQHAIAAIYVDLRLGPLSTRDRQLVGRLIRNAVLGSKECVQSDHILSSDQNDHLVRIDNNGKMSREWRRKQWAG